MATQAGGIRVLLVDDHRMVREAIRRLLTNAQNIDVVGEADNGAEAIASIGKLSPQVVVMDINMPKYQYAENGRTSGDQAGAETLSKRRCTGIIRHGRSLSQIVNGESRGLPRDDKGHARLR
jgi:DNA-binding NarL/FixJ family response regulator